MQVPCLLSPQVAKQLQHFLLALYYRLIRATRTFPDLVVDEIDRRGAFPPYRHAHLAVVAQGRVFPGREFPVCHIRFILWSREILALCTMVHNGAATTYFLPITALKELLAIAFVTHDVG